MAWSGVETVDATTDEENNGAEVIQSAVYNGCARNLQRSVTDAFRQRTHTTHTSYKLLCPLTSLSTARVAKYEAVTRFSLCRRHSE